MAEAILSIASKNYGSWSLRGWLLCKMSGLDFEEQQVSADDPSTRAELLLLSPSFLVPCLTHDGLKIWDTLAIAEYLHEINPGARLFPSDRAQRAHCRSICGEMHSGFSNLRSALPMNIKARFAGFKAWAGARADIDRIASIWRECFDAYSGPYLFRTARLRRRRHVRASLFSLYDLRRCPRRGRCGLFQHDDGLSLHERMDRGGKA